MIAARTVSREKLIFENMPIPEVAEGEALVRVLHVTLCGTDLHIWQDDYASELPIVQGHEFVGRIEAFGSGTTSSLVVGDTVAVSPMIFCGRCYACRIGRFNACQNMSVYGCYQDGALVELMAIPVEKLHRVPDDVPPAIASLSEPMSIALQAVRRSRAVAGEKALVFGCGAIGLLATLCLVDAGVDVVVADVVAERVAHASRFGASEGFVIDASESFPASAHRRSLSRFTGGDGPSIVIEATGAPARLADAVAVVANAGRVVAVGVSNRTVDLSVSALALKEIDLLGSRNSLDLLDESLRLIAAHADAVTSLVTHRFALDELATAFETMRDQPALVGKIRIDL